MNIFFTWSLLLVLAQTVTVQRTPVQNMIMNFQDLFDAPTNATVSNKALMAKDERSLLVKRQSQEMEDRAKAKKKSKGTAFDCFDILEDVHFPKKKDLAETVEEKKKHLYMCLQFPAGFSKEKCCQYCPFKNPFWPADKCKTPNGDLSKQHATMTFWETTLNTQPGRDAYTIPTNAGEGATAAPAYDTAAGHLTTPFYNAATYHKFICPATTAKTWILEFMLDMVPADSLPVGKWNGAGTTATAAANTLKAGGAELLACQPVKTFVQQHGTTVQSHVTGAFGGTQDMPVAIKCQCDGYSTAPCTFYSDDLCTVVMDETLFPVEYYDAVTGAPSTPTPPEPIPGTLPLKTAGGQKVKQHSCDYFAPSYWVSSDVTTAVNLHGRRDFKSTCGSPTEASPTANPKGGVTFKFYPSDVCSGAWVVAPQVTIYIDAYKKHLESDGIDMTGITDQETAVGWSGCTASTDCFSPAPTERAASAAIDWHGRENPTESLCVPFRVQYGVLADTSTPVTGFTTQYQGMIPVAATGGTDATGAGAGETGMAFCYCEGTDSVSCAFRHASAGADGKITSADHTALCVTEQTATTYEMKIEAIPITGKSKPPATLAAGDCIDHSNVKITGGSASAPHVEPGNEAVSKIITNLLVKPLTCAAAR